MLDFEEFKRMFHSREYRHINRSYDSVISFISEAYSEDEIAAFYFKNGMNDKPKELIFVLSNGVLVVTKNDDEFSYEHFSEKVVNKKLKTSKYLSQVYELVITLESGKSIIFNNIEDSNHDWAEEYAESIKEIYKSV